MENNDLKSIKEETKDRSTRTPPKIVIYRFCM